MCERCERKVVDVEALYSHHAYALRRSLLKLGIPKADVEDLLQEVFVNVLEARGAFQRRSKVFTWLVGVTIHLANNHRRRLRRHQPPDAAQDDPPATADRLLEIEERRAWVRDVLEHISHRSRKVLILLDIEGNDYTAAAALLGLRAGALRVRHLRARREFIDHAISMRTRR